MNLMSTLLKRELQEHKAGFLWLPLGTLAFLVILTIAVFGAGDVDVVMHGLSSTDNNSSTFSLEGEHSASSLLSTGLTALDTLSDEKKNAFFGAVRTASSLVFYVLFMAMSIFYLASSLFEERADRSILFWKSMPVSDWQAVLSKLLSILLIVPAIFILAIAIYQIALFSIVSLAGLFKGAPIASLWLDSGLMGGWIQLIMGYLIQGLWMLPLYGWLLFVSSWVTRSPILVATIAPFIPVMLEASLFQTRYLLEWMSAHVKIVALPSISIFTNNTVEGFGLQSTLATVARGDFYFGILVGAGLIAGAIWFRRLKNDI